MLRSFIIVSLLAFTSACGVQNYDECVLKEMKGQSREMITHARDLCEAKFPFEKEIYGYKDNIDIGWWSTSDSIHLNISNNYGNYRITRYKASFSEKKCSDTDTYTLTKTLCVRTWK